MTTSRLFLLTLGLGWSVLAQAQGLSPVLQDGLAACLGALAVLLVIYGVRHYVLTLHRLFVRQRRPFHGLHAMDWPRLTVFIAAHNEQDVVGRCIEALVAADYPHDRLRIIPVNDRSSDNTRAVCDEWAARYPVVQPFHRVDGPPGKPAALRDAVKLAPDAEVYAVFDADYVPGKGLLKQLVAPFVDVRVGVTMGRVVPYNTGTNLLTRMLDMERSAGYQGDQQARMNMRTVPQYGGTVGAIRARALAVVGGFQPGILAEDTDLTFRLLERGWKVAYVNDAECYEEVPEVWSVRVKQLKRWAKGHTQAMVRFAWTSLTNRHLGFRERLEALLLLGCYGVAPLTLAGWALILAAAGFFAQSVIVASSLAVLAVVLYGGFGNAAAFFQMAASVRLDGHARRLRLLPLNFIGYLVSAVTITRGAASFFVDAVLKREMRWDKTVRFNRMAPAVASPSGQGPGVAEPATEERKVA